MSQDQPIVLDPTYASFDAAARPADLGATHFIGIGGAGMSVLAEMLHAEGCLLYTAQICEFLMQKYEVPVSSPRKNAIPVTW